VEIGVVRQQTLGLGGREQVLIGGHQDETGEILTKQRVFQEERAGKMDGVITAQLLPAGQTYRVGDHGLVYIYQPVLVTPIAL
jgi:hypothetical protein